MTLDRYAALRMAAGYAVRTAFLSVAALNGLIREARGTGPRCAP